MAASEYNYLDTIPLSNIHYQAVEGMDPSRDLVYREELNLGFNIVHAEGQVSKRQKALGLYYQSRDSLKLKDLNLILESNLYLLNYLSCISNLDNTKLSPHYKKWKELGNYQTINPGYLRELLYTEEKTWGGKRGSLSYCLYLQNNIDHYCHISDITHNCLKELFKKDTLLVTRLLDEDSLSDGDIYSYTTQAVINFPDLQYHLDKLRFLETWGPKIIKWYLEVPRRTSEEEEFLAGIVRNVLRQNLDYTSFDKLEFKFLHQEISYSCLDVYSEVLRQRKHIGFSVVDLESSMVKDLLLELTEKIDIDKNLDYRELSIAYLNEFYPIGGFNTLLVGLAAGLLNKALILSNNLTWANYELQEPANPQGFKELIGRVFKLIYFAGYSLKKSNLDHLNIVGVNLVKFTGITDTSPNRIYNL